MKTKSKQDLLLDTRKYQMLSIILIALFIVTFILFANISMKKEQQIKPQLLISTSGDTVTLNLNLSIKGECELAQVWQDYLIKKNGGTDYLFRIIC